MGVEINYVKRKYQGKKNQERRTREEEPGKKDHEKKARRHLVQGVN
jgi:hypothetical protein